VLEEALDRRGLRIGAWHGLLALSPDPPAPCPWALNIWTAPRLLAAPSIGAAVDALRGMQRNWGLFPTPHGGRAKLIAARLPPIKSRPLVFPCAAPTAHLGAWTLLGPDALLASPTQTSPFVNGMVTFEEDRSGPPSRAYLKLWEALALWRQWPMAGETCLDLGASPGGWTWVLARLGARVTAVDKALLDPRVAAMPGVTMRRDSAFALNPAAEPAVDWLFSDVIAYPARLLRLVQAWIEAGRTRRIVCTVKFQGETDHAAAEGFAAIPGGALRHLCHNKHELTFFWQAPGAVGGGLPLMGDGC
jgi:23S rRNA (cytidine2498-2'-O)-methyltransferase